MIFVKASFAFIYTVLTQSQPESTHDLVNSHHVQALYPHHVLLPYCIISHPTHASIGHVILSVTAVVFVEVAPLLIVKRTHVIGDNLAIKASDESPLLTNGDNHQNIPSHSKYPAR